jgi:MFS family permease
VAEPGVSGDTPQLSISGQNRVLVVLCGTQIVSWGVLYYAFPILAPNIAADTGWSVPAVTAAFSVGLVVSAVVGIPAGRLLDRFGPRLVMTAGSVLAVPAVVIIGSTRSFPLFVTGWVLAGVGMACTLYPPAFAALTRWWGKRRVTALTALTLVAGLSSTVFAPLTAVLLDHLQWQRSYLVLSGLLALLTIPAHYFGLRGPWPKPDDAEPSAAAEQAPEAIARSRPFVLLTLAMALGTFTAFAVIVNQVPLLLERGLTTELAAWALGLGGLGQVLGRLGYTRLVAATGVRLRGVLILALTAIATALLGVLPGPGALLIAAAMLAGAARGVLTLLQATAISERWGGTHYGRLNGLLSAPVMLATALAPWAGAALAQALGGYPAVFAVLAGIAALAALLAAGSVPPPATASGWTGRRTR